MAGDIKTDTVTAYAEDVVSGKSKQCLYVRQACQRHLIDLEKGEYFWSWAEALKAILFCRLLKHYKGPAAGSVFNPEPWQQFIIGSIFGWLKDDGSRRFRIGYIEVPRKNGKTFTAAAIALKALFFDEEPGGEVYAVATKNSQARIVWDDCKHMILKTTSLKHLATIRHSVIAVPSTASKFLPLAKDTSTMDGLNPSFAISDEVHAWKDPMLFNQMQDAMGARRQPFNLMITTAGNNQEGICYKFREHVKSVLGAVHNSSYQDEETFGIIYTIDKKDNWKSKASWYKANPNLGVSKTVEYMAAQVKMAKQISSEEFTVKNKQFNIWTTADEAWLNMDRWDKCAGKIDLETLRGQKCHLGVDLSSVQDLSAVVALFPPGPYDEWVILPILYLPEDRLELRQRRDRVPYVQWQKEGHLTTTPGDVIDLEFIKFDILKLTERYAVESVGFDPWKATEIASWLIAEGVNMVQMRQGHQTMGAPTASFEKLVLQKKLRHGGQPILRWMANNVGVIRNSNDDIRPKKMSNTARVDGIVAAIMALGRAQEVDPEQNIKPTAHIIEI